MLEDIIKGFHLKDKVNVNELQFFSGDRWIPVHHPERLKKNVWLRIRLQYSKNKVINFSYEMNLLVREDLSYDSY
tara:strand:- start:118 stop:342 length:225 start_codon:yes stop_codon:yes gene_type:complete